MLLLFLRSPSLRGEFSSEANSLNCLNADLQLFGQSSAFQSLMYLEFQEQNLSCDHLDLIFSWLLLFPQLDFLDLFDNYFRVEEESLSVNFGLFSV